MPSENSDSTTVKKNNEISPYTYQNSYHQKDNTEQMLERMWRKGKPLYTVGGGVNLDNQIHGK